ncbi:MAG: aminoacyl-tRNA hydrolase [Brevinematia bacterium]
MKLVVGLGNPGETYEGTRHNLGFMVLDRLAARHGTSVDIKKKKSMVGRIKLGKERVMLLKPQTFVNLSGEAVLYMASFLRVMPENIIVVCDDINLPLGKIRVRRYGSSGGHNGVKSLIQFLRSDNFPRVRIGIGSPKEGEELEKFVLGKFTPEELEVINPAMDKACDAIELIIQGEIDKAMNLYNE